MSDFAFALGIAAVVAYGFYALIESLEIFSASRNFPKSPASGPETAPGTRVHVITSFSKSNLDKVTGRIRFEGEDWNAVLVGQSSVFPKVGDHVTILEIDAARLKVFVE